MFKKWILMIICILFFGLPGISRADVLEIPGTGSCQTILLKLAQEFNRRQSGITVVVPASIGSSGGIRETLADRAEIARVARQLKPEEIQGGLSALAFAKDLLIFAVGNRVEVKKLTKEQLQGIYTGRFTNWNEVGGQDMPIRVLSRQTGDANLVVVQKHLDGFGDNVLTKRAKTLYTDQEMVDMINKYPSAIGFGTRSEMLLRGIDTAMTIGDMKPTTDAVVSGNYPLTTSYYLIFKESKLSSGGRRFLDFVFSKDGQDVISKYKLVPLSR